MASLQARIAVAVLVGATLLIACGTRTQPVCGPSTCAVGCCDSTGACVSGMTNSACGDRGGQCAACPISGICQAGRCGFVGGTGGGVAGGSAGGAAGGAAGGSAGGGSASDAGAMDAGFIPGGPCNLGGFLCDSAAAALECKVGRWVLLPCRGDGGCAITMGTVSCDMHGNLAGDACASTAEAKGLCAADGKGTLECRSGVLVMTNVCRTCTEQNDTVICTP